MHHTSQRMLACQGGAVVSLELPHPSHEVLPGIRWGRFDQALTPAFWAGRVWLSTQSAEHDDYQLGSTLAEEVAACLLGGYGIPAEVGLAAFQRLRCSGMLECGEEGSFREALEAPLSVGGRLVRYRFAKQKSRCLASALTLLPTLDEETLSDRDLRDALTDLPGVGLKTASWITRNWRRSNDVAILDVHVCRGCAEAGIFPGSMTPQRHYRKLESLFLRFAQALGAPPSVLDNVMWKTMRVLPAGWLIGVANEWNPIRAGGSLTACLVAEEEGRTAALVPEGLAATSSRGSRSTAFSPVSSINSRSVKS